MKLRDAVYRCNLRKHVVVPFGLAVALGMLMSLACASDFDEPIAFRNVRVFDGARTLPSVTVIVRNGIIEQVGRDVNVPSGVRVIVRRPNKDS